MNGEYLIANPNRQAPTPYSTDYGAKNAEYVDLYTPPIRTVYGEVFWTMMDPIPLPKDLVARFANKTMAVVGYEVDQVYRTPEGDQSVPIIWAYNHHYEAYLLGKYSRLERVNGTTQSAMGRNHGAPNYWQMVNSNPDPTNTIPDAQYFSEGNGGEFRKSYHGYPNGFAQLINSPEVFKVQPMQIDTHNRDYHGPGFKAGLLPRSSGAPPNASYSGLLECPCTTRTEKNWSTTYSTATTGSCQHMVLNASECFLAAAKVGLTPTSTQQVQSGSLPTGCLVMANSNGTHAVIFNSMTTSQLCGTGARVFAGSVSAEVSVNLSLDTTQQGGLATIVLTGPSTVWFGVGFDATAMGDLPYAIIVDGKGNVTERKLGDHDPGTLLQPTQVRVVSNTVTGSLRTVVLSRAFKGATANHYTFNPSVGTLNLIHAVGQSVQLAFHKTRGASVLSMAAVDGATCICNSGTKGTINGLPFNRNCAPEPTADLLQQRNPTCFIETYAGGILCCHHGQVLLDADQPVDNRTDEYSLKFRFWFQDYVPATTQEVSNAVADPVPQQAAAPASHQNLHRFYFTTEAYAGEYDVVKCSDDLPAEQCVQEITAHWQVKDMVDCNYDPDCHDRSGVGINLIYAGGHCHTPSCISLDLYNADTGELICSQSPVSGQGSAIPFDELDYIAIPPCLWGPKSEGLIEPALLTWDTNLLSIKRNNNTYTHYGEMASWQMRGVFVY